MRRILLIVVLLVVSWGLWVKTPTPAHADWFQDLIDSLTHTTGSNLAIPDKLEKHNKSILPLVGITPISQPTTTPVARQAAQTQSSGSLQATTQSSNTSSAMDKAATGYTIACGATGCEPTPVPADVGSFFIQWLGNLLGIRDEGNKQATNFANSNAPPGVAENTLAQWGSDKNALAQGSETSSVLGFPAGACTDPMTCAYAFRECGALPPSACEGVISQLYTPPTATPTPVPTLVPTIGPTSPPIPTGGEPLTQCHITSDTANACYWKKFLPYLNNDEKEAKIASKICSLESGGGNAFALNDRCLASKYPDPAKRTRDYSVGLFQINLLAHQKDHCDGVLIDNWNTKDPIDNTFMRSCSIVAGKESTLNSCVNKLYGVDYNIKAMIKIRDAYISYFGWDKRWNAWSTYTQIVSKCTDLIEGVPSGGGNPDPFPANCPDPSTRIAVPNTQYKKLDQSLGCMRPTMIVIHWSAAWTTAEATFNTLNKGKIDPKTGQFYRNGCQFATDHTHQLQLQDFWNDQVIWGYCVGGSENSISINDEISGSYFERLLDANNNIIINKNDYTDYGYRLKLESDRSIATTCWVMKQYNIPLSQVIGHLEAPWGKTSGKIDPSLKYMEYYRKRLSQECR